jgi:hypothetical protein
MNSNDKKWTVAEVLTNFGQRQSQIQQEKMVKQQLKDALMQNQAQSLSQFVPGMQQEMPPMQQDMSLDQAYQEAKRGGIHLDPRKKGTFKAQATRMGMSIQEAASHILANRKEYSPAMVKKANFARNFAKEEGGEMMDNPCPDGYVWDGVNCIPAGQRIDQLKNLLLEKQTANRATGNKRTIEMVYTNPGTYIVKDENGQVLYEGPNDTLAKSIYAAGKEGPKDVRMMPSMIGVEPTDPRLKGWAQDPNTPFKKGGEMIKRADGSYSQRGLWDNIRANRGSGKEPTKEMLQQERKIRRKAEGGPTDCPEDFEWNETLQSCVPIVTENYAKDYLTDWYSRRGKVVNDPNFDGLSKPKGHAEWLGKVLPMINERMATSPLTYAYPDIIDGDPALRGTYTRQTKTQGPVIEISSMARQNPFEHAATDLHERTTDSTFTAEKYVEPQHQKIINENIKSYEDFRDASPIADQVKADQALDDELYDEYMYSTGQTPEGLGNMHSYVMNWRKMFNMDPTKVYSEEEIADMVKQAENAGMFTKGSPAFNDDMYKLFKLSKDNKSMTDLFNLMVNNTSPVKPNRFNDDIQYAKHGGSFGYMPDFF